MNADKVTQLAKEAKQIYQRVAYTTDWVRLGAMLRRTREDTGVSLRSVAKLVGVSAPYLSDVERGRRSISDENLSRLLAHLARLINLKK